MTEDLCNETPCPIAAATTTLAAKIAERVSRNHQLATADRLLPFCLEPTWLPGPNDSPPSVQFLSPLLLQHLPQLSQDELRAALAELLGRAHSQFGTIRVLADLRADLKTETWEPSNIRVCCELWVAGRYVKFQRGLSQTPWKMAKDSVSAAIERILRTKAHIDFDEARFVAAGREDADVRMLGSGRPFVMNLLNPRGGINLAFSQCPLLNEPAVLSSLAAAELNNDDTEMDVAVRVRQLRIVSRSEAAKIKEGEVEKRKVYRCLIWIEHARPAQDLLDQINGMEDLQLVQYTPVRVVHRRSNLARKKTIHWMSANVVAENHLHVTLESEAGTYIKEFMHGDMGRTKPSFGDLLGCTVDILELDVMKVDLEWPPTVMSCGVVPISSTVAITT